MSAFQAVDPHFEARVRESFSRQPFMETLGAELTDVRPGHVTIEMPCRPELGQQNGFIHAGAVASIADSACGYAAYTLMPADTDVLAVEFKLNLMAPAHGERISARARVLRPGRTLTVCAADVFAIRDGGAHPVATMLGTVIRR